MAHGDSLPDGDHFSRYCRPGALEDGAPSTAAFTLREGEDHLSVNWIEYFQRATISQAVDCVREAFVAKNFDLSRNGRFVVLVAGLAVEAIRDGAEKQVSILHWPDIDVDNWPDDDVDPSHSGIFGYGVDEVQVAIELQALASEQQMFLAVT